MPAHPEFVADFSAALRGGALPPGLTAGAGDDVARRFAVYRNNVTASLSAALSTRFPVIRRLVGADFFAALSRRYAEAEPPSCPVIAEWGAGFAAFLDGFPPLSAYPYLGDVARIEFARGRAYHAADALPVDPARLIAADPDRIRFRLHPSVTLLALSHPAVSIWTRNQPGAIDAPLATGPETALILRDATFQVPVQSVGAGDAALLAALLEGLTLSAAAGAAQLAECGHDPQPLLVALMRAGAISDIKEC